MCTSCYSYLFHFPISYLNNISDADNTSYNIFTLHLYYHFLSANQSAAEYPLTAVPESQADRPIHSSEETLRI